MDCPVLLPCLSTGVYAWFREGVALKPCDNAEVNYHMRSMATTKPSTILYLCTDGNVLGTAGLLKYILDVA